MTVKIQNNDFFSDVSYLVIFLTTHRYLLIMKDNNLKSAVISQLSGNYFDIGYASYSFAPMLPNVLVNKKRSNNGANLKAGC